MSSAPSPDAKLVLALSLSSSSEHDRGCISGRLLSVIAGNYDSDQCVESPSEQQEICMELQNHIL